MIVITGASGQLGRLVIEALLQTVPAGEIVAAVRNPEKIADLAARGVQVRVADYDQPASLAAAFAGADKLLLISANEVGRRVPQHRAVIEAATAAGVGLLAYTSILHADSSPLPLAAEHQETEALIRASGLPAVILRNGWYTENYLAGIPTALQYGVVLGSAGAGRIASAARTDYAAAAAAVLTRDDQAGHIYELAGDESYTLAELAAEIAKQSGQAVNYQNLPESEFKAALLGAGLPDFLVTLLAESDVGASKGGLFDDSRQLSQLIGRSTTSLANMVAAQLAATAA
ncbi:SDR family oxidoreductase [Quatrionicoccus australiensis]|uniref:SDR family oxidoreductase n=1 Tax=Quatrionicoccus australiensis TaxID=138118 RepID=UPI001CFBEAB4|nr:SDR family oxidoreductase [Quatrionicoccus australiensis]MCB4358271.1 SDR family oxidoreductase [Quatrionicoccus australiensis]